MCLQKEKEAHAEDEEKRRMEEELREQRRLIDALSAETMALREEVTVLQVRLRPPEGVVSQAPTQTSPLVAPGQAAAAGGGHGAEAGHGGAGDGRTWTAGASQ